MSSFSLPKKYTGFFFVLILLFSSVPKDVFALVEVRFAYIGDESHSSLLGIRQGLIEANLQGQFLGQKYMLDVVSTENSTITDFSGYIAVITAVKYDHFVKLSDHLPAIPLFNLSITDDSLRSLCLPNALHVIPSNRMKADAVKQWQQKESGSQVTAQAWHGDFVKFAARDLNKRFKKKNHQPMDDYAWAGWAAVKMTSDSVARENITEAKNMLNYLKTSLNFDGQKGSSMNFRETGQLRQLLLLVQQDKIVAEAPVRGIAKPPTLDSLGLLSCDK